MQQIWSQALRGHICCNCRRSMHRSFHSNALNVHLRPVARRSTTSARSIGARNGRRKIGASEVFTAFYTSIMATAALADASHKDRRRKDLDQRIIEARKDLARVLRESSLADCNIALNTEGLGLLLQKGDDMSGTSINMTSHRTMVEGLESICISLRQLMRHESRAKLQDSHLSWLHMQFGLRRRWWTQRPAANTGLDDIEAALHAEEHALTDCTDCTAGNRQQEEVKEGNQREPQTLLQFSKMAEATNRLVDELLVEANRLGHPDSIAAQKAAMESLDSPWTAIRMLRSDGYPMYRHPELAPEGTLEARLAANTAMRQIFQDWEYTKAYGPLPTSFLSGRRQPEENWYQKRIKFWVAKLCYNLLVSTAPPGVHNYNALVLGFTRVGEHSLAELVVNSFLYQSRLLPTRQTLVCLLQHYRARGDLVGFYRVIRRLVAVDARGAKIRRRTLADLRLRPHLRGWAKTHDVAVTDGYVVQRANIDAPLFNAILTGLLSLGQVRHAALAFANFLNDCCGIDPEVLNRVANCVLDAVDVPAARALLQGLVENASLVTPMLLSETRYARKLSFKIRLLLSVASASEPSWRLQTQHQTLDQGCHGLADGNCERIARALFVSDTLQYVKRLDQIMMAARGAAATNSAAFRTSRSWSVELDSLHKHQQRLDRERSLYRRMAELKTVDEAAESVFRACTYVMETFLHIVSDNMDVPDVYKGFLRQSQLPFSVRFASYIATLPDTAAPATTGSQQQALLERLIAVDGPAVGSFIEDGLKHVVLLHLSPDERTAAGIDAVKNTAGDVTLDAVLKARTLRDQRRPAHDGGGGTEADQFAPKTKEKGRHAIDFGARYPYSLFGAAAILPSS